MAFSWSRTTSAALGSRMLHHQRADLPALALHAQQPQVSRDMYDDGLGLG